MDKEEKQFATGFNNGYLIAKYLPQLFKKLQKSISNTGEYFQGFFSGAKEYDIETQKSRLDDLQKVRKSKPRDRGLER